MKFTGVVFSLNGFHFTPFWMKVFSEPCTCIGLCYMCDIYYAREPHTPVFSTWAKQILVLAKRVIWDVFEWSAFRGFIRLLVSFMRFIRGGVFGIHQSSSQGRRPASLLPRITGSKEYTWNGFTWNYKIYMPFARVMKNFTFVARIHSRTSESDLIYLLYVIFLFLYTRNYVLTYSSYCY